MSEPFFLLGAPKCATSSIYDLLARHPQIWCPSVKEPGFFTREDVLEPARSADPHMASWRGYSELYATAGESGVWCDGSTSYLRSPGAMSEIRQTFPNAKALVMVRDPIELVSSYFTFLTYEGWETEPSLESAWAVQEQRRRGEFGALPPAVKRPSSLVYAEVAMLGRQVEAAQAVFGPDLLVRTVGDLRRDQRRFVKAVLNHAGVDSSLDLGELPRTNPAREARWNWVNQISTSPPPWLAGLKARVKAKLGVRSLGLRAQADRWNSKQVDRQVDERMVLMLRSYFRPDVELLSTLLSRDLIEEWGW